MVYDITRRATYNHLSGWLTDAKSLTNPNTVIFLIGKIGDQTLIALMQARLYSSRK